MDNFNVYKDIQARTGGEIYIGVVGPVRTGKSTFIKRFMDLLVIPEIEDVHSRERAVDELPQSAAGRTIMTTEPKFIPKEAAEVSISEDTKVKIRMIDCVGYMVDGAAGHIEDEQERMVKTPWFDYEIPFTQAAEIGTKKVINDHSTIGIVITTDGSFGDLPRANYLAPEEKTIDELKKLSKPFVILLNSSKPYSEETGSIAASMEEKYEVPVLTVNCEQLRKDDITKIMENILEVFPISEISFFMPKWVDMLSRDHALKQEIIKAVKTVLKDMKRMKDVRELDYKAEALDIVRGMKVERIFMEDGRVKILLEVDDTHYYKILSDMTGIEINDEYQLIATLKELAGKKNEYLKMENACSQVSSKGYGVVNPVADEIILEEPELIRHGNKFGVKIKASAPSIHLISATIQTEIAPIIGTEEQANDLISYINEGTSLNPGVIRDALIFGKSIGNLVEDGIQAKISRMTEECQVKMQETLQKIINESSGGIVFVII